MFENLGKLYNQLGGLGAILKTAYFWVALFFFCASYESIPTYSWAVLTLSVMPSLTGFTIAAFAIIFVILDDKMLETLSVVDDSGRSPMTKIAAAIGFAVLIQVIALVLAMSFKTVDLNNYLQINLKEMSKVGYSPEKLVIAVDWIKKITSALGLFCTYYGVMLVLAAILSIFRMQLIVAHSKKAKKVNSLKKS